MVVNLENNILKKNFSNKKLVCSNINTSYSPKKIYDRESLENNEHVHRAILKIIGKKENKGLETKLERTKTKLDEAKNTINELIETEIKLKKINETYQQEPKNATFMLDKYKEFITELRENETFNTYYKEIKVLEKEFIGLTNAPRKDKNINRAKTEGIKRKLYGFLKEQNKFKTHQYMKKITKEVYTYKNDFELLIDYEDNKINFEKPTKIFSKTKKQIKEELRIIEKEKKDLAETVEKKEQEKKEYEKEKQDFFDINIKKELNELGYIQLLTLYKENVNGEEKRYIGNEKLDEKQTRGLIEIDSELNIKYTSFEGETINTNRKLLGLIYTPSLRYNISEYEIGQKNYERGDVIEYPDIFNEEYAKNIKLGEVLINELELGRVIVSYDEKTKEYFLEGKIIDKILN